MCYMTHERRGSRRSARGSVGVRELRQNLSVYLRRVAAGEALEVTERGRAVAVLAPLGADAGIMERLVAAGRATRARGDLLELGPPRGRVSRRATVALNALREDRI